MLAAVDGRVGQRLIVGMLNDDEQQVRSPGHYQHKQAPCARLTPDANSYNPFGPNAGKPEGLDTALHASIVHHLSIPYASSLTATPFVQAFSISRKLFRLVVL